MKKPCLYLLALTILFAGAARAQQTTYYVPVPSVVSGVTDIKVEMLRSNLALTNVQTTFVPNGKSALDETAHTLKAYIGPSTSSPNPLLELNGVATSGGMAIMEPVPGLQAIEVSFEMEESPIRTAWKLPLLTADDFFAANSTVYVLNLVKATDAQSNLQILNPGTLATTCTATVLRPKGTVIETRGGITVPAQGVVGIPNILRGVTAAEASGINVAVTCDSPFYALGAYPATNRWDTRVEYPVTELPGTPIPVTLDTRNGLFFHATAADGDLKIPVALDPNTVYHTLNIDFDVTVANPPGFVVFRNVIGMFRLGGRRFGKTLYFGSFENFNKQKYVIDLGSPFIETTLKRSFQLVGGHTYHYAITVDNDQRSIHYVITNPSGGVITDILGGLYNDFNVVAGNAPIIDIGVIGVADNAYFPPVGWRFANFSLVATK